MALTQNDEIIEDMFPFDQASATPDKLRKVFRSGAYRGTTAAMADGYTGKFGNYPGEIFT